MPTIDFVSRVVMLAAAIALGSVSSAEAATDTAFRYSTPQTGSLILGPADFEPEQSGSQYGKGGATLIYTTGDTQICFLAPLHLPQQATFGRVTLFYSRPGDASVGITVRRLNAEGTNYDFLANPTLSSAPVTPRGKVSYAGLPSTNVINNRLYNYSVQMCLTKNAAFYNARIEYTYTNAGD